MLWTPEKSQEGNSFPVTIRVFNEIRGPGGTRAADDGPLNLSRELDLTVRVQAIQTLSTVVDGSDLVVSDRSSALEGVRFRFLDDAVENRSIAIANDAYLLNQDPYAITLSETFYLLDDYNGRLEVMVPGTLSAGSSIGRRMTIYEMFNRPIYSINRWSLNPLDRQELFVGSYYNVFTFPEREYRVPMYVGVRPKGPTPRK